MSGMIDGVSRCWLIRRSSGLSVEGFRTAADLALFCARNVDSVDGTAWVSAEIQVAKMREVAAAILAEADEIEQREREPVAQFDPDDE
jgi:hypothetical protein